MHARNPQEDKAALRRRQRAALRNSCPEDRAALAAALREHLVAWLEARRVRTAMIYWPLPDEPSLAGLPGRLRALGLEVAYPRVIESTGRMEARGVDDERAMVPGAFGLLEPDPACCPSLPADRIDAALVPGLAFDPVSGLRLGRGAGFYDRFLSQSGFQGQAVGIAFPEHLVPGLPGEPHDRRMDWIATPAGVAPVGRPSD